MTGMLDITGFLVAGPNLPFLVAGCVVLALLLIELVMLTVGQSMMLFDSSLDLNLDLDGNGIPDHLETGWGLSGLLNPGHLPSTLFLVVFCGLFSLIGVSAQWTWFRSMGEMAPVFLSVPVTLVPTLALTRWFSVGLARVMPQVETNAVTLESLAGQLGVLTVGPIKGLEDKGMARFTDDHGVDHTVLVMSHDGSEISILDPVILSTPHPTNPIAFYVRKI